jgi:ATP-dependent helicase/nuclease subunit B
MLKLIYGPPSSGKTYYTDTLVLKALKSGKKAFLIVPEQEAIEAENRIYDRAAASGVFTERLSVVSFRRLADLTFRKYGGIEYSDIGEGGKLVLLWKCISEASPELCHFKNTSDRAFVELMKSVCDELKRYCVTPSQLSAVADKLSDGRFGKKLNDVAYIYAKFNTALINNSLDSVDDVSRLADILRKEHPDPEATYFIDSFNGFTRPEFSVIESLCEYSDVYVTVNRFKEEGRTGFMTVESTEKELKELSAYTTVETEAVLDGKDFNGHAEFELIRNSLYGSYKPSTGTAPSERISFYACKDAFSQAEIIAINIKKLIRSGARYRDIAVISRNADAYEGTLDVVFGKYGIPLFLSSRSPMLKTDLYRAVSSALDIILGGFRSEDVMTYIKSGVCGFTLEEIDIIESYVSLWNINGKRWTEEDDWIMNPHGFYFSDSDDTSTLERTDALLATVNSVRRRITAPLTELKEDIKGSTVKEACAALYRFITKSGITDHYLTADSVGVTVYNTFIKMLDSLVKVAGELTVNAQTLSSLLHLMAKNTDYGRIPSTFDSVIAGDASIIRCNGVKHVFLTDCESGKFPATVTDDSFFSENEKELLRSHKLTVAPRISERNDLEAFYFLRSAGEATETLTATFCVSGSEEYPSQGFERLTELFPNNPVQHYPSETAVTDRIQTENTALEAYAALKKTDRAELLDEVFGELGISTSLSETPISDANAFLSRQTVNTLFGNGINMTATRLEAYVKCPFSYFCGNVLKLAAKKHSFFAASDAT